MSEDYDEDDRPDTQVEVGAGAAIIHYWEDKVDRVELSNGDTLRVGDYLKVTYADEEFIFQITDFDPDLGVRWREAKESPKKQTTPFPISWECVLRLCETDQSRMDLTNYVHSDVRYRPAPDTRIDEHVKRFGEYHAVRECTESQDIQSYRCMARTATGLTWVRGFRITFTPGTLTVVGDIGDLVITRTRNMAGWFRQSMQDPDYVASKVPSVISCYEGDEDQCQQYLFEYFRDNLFVHLENLDFKEAKDEIEKLEEGYQTCRDYLDSEGPDHPALHQAWYDMTDDYEGLSGKRFTGNFCWCFAAVKWFVQTYPDYPINSVEYHI